MKRREFIGALGTTAAATIPGPLLSSPTSKLYIVSLSFDDGFKKSFLRIADIHEKLSLFACFNIKIGDAPLFPLDCFALISLVKGAEIGERPRFRNKLLCADLLAVTPGRHAGGAVP